MKTFDPSLHPRGQAANPGQFRERADFAPGGGLDFEDDAENILVSAGREGALAAMQGEPVPAPEAVFQRIVGRAPAEDDADQVTELAEHFRAAYDLAKPSDRSIDVDRVLAGYADARAEKIGRVNVNDGDDDAYEEYEDAVMERIDEMFEALKRYRAKEKAAEAAEARPAMEVAVAAVKRIAALDAARLTGQNAVAIATAAVEADRAARAGYDPSHADPVKLDPRPWRSDASGLRYAQKPNDGHGPYRFMPQDGFSPRRADYA